MRVIVAGRMEQRSWEAEEVGPSLRFATADVHRTERRNGQVDRDAPVEDATAG
jgi:single-stranded DNA-binding protein